MNTTTTQMKPRKKKQPRKVARTEPAVCDYCDGAGVTEKMGFGYGGGYSRLRTCPKCHGSGS